MNSAIELHDSRVLDLTRSGDSIVVRFRPAYVHRSDGRPGIDPGFGWVQDVDLVVLEAVLESSFTEMPQELDGGSLWVGSDVFESIVPFPFDVRGALRFTALSLRGEWLVIRGTRLAMTGIGDARYVEPFPGTRSNGH